VAPRSKAGCGLGRWPFFSHAVEQGGQGWWKERIQGEMLGVVTRAYGGGSFGPRG
jgi:hypothetical protein